MGKERREVARRSLAGAQSYENNKQSERTEGGPILESRAEADAAVVQRGKERGETETDDEVREINRAGGDAVDLEGIERRKNVTGDAADSDGLPGTDDEVGEHHHPSGGKADGAGKSCSRIGDFAGSVWHGGDEPAIDPADWEKQRATNGEAQ